MVSTFSDFDWLTAQYEWVENGLFVAYVTDTDPPTVIDSLCTRLDGEAIGLDGLNERYWDEFSVIGATQIGEVTLAIAPGTNVTNDELRILSAGRRVVMHSKSVNADCHFSVWDDGTEVVSFDPLLRTSFTGDGAIPEQWRIRLRDVGIDPDGTGPMQDGRFHVLEASFALAANYLSHTITDDQISHATFLCGIGRN
ncbi:hypothetical protein E5720_17880 [Rhodococcus sp. PAMC28707]|uniref:DUF6461 domain-containing protein n=1 Tax=unclassified Rhodococcus (in: high G+C Gram-positive bacteria) TaxID=192944 RepID=UPI00109D8EE3|nr:MULTISPECIES: DUF6461 domain-containing protein [unclassified Rhodococcus (in: high G+C Gram-positive bacteria)]QCB51755.1 hypothetical protein E5769_17645 [Rhodococcus sp. PAMC28705]QCB60077.1 hypothetical protein E5720_17880 [Rhodococcus sp. PAMC28707]